MSTSKEPTQHKETVARVLSRELFNRADRTRAVVDDGNNVVALARHAVDAHEPGSAWHLAELALLEAAERAVAAEEANLNTYLTAARTIRDLDD